MTKLEMTKPAHAQNVADELSQTFARRLAAGTNVACPVEFAAAFAAECGAQSCGKCTPCRIGLAQLKQLMDELLDGRGNARTVKLIEDLAQDAYLTADCAIGYEAAAAVLRAVRGFKDDFMSHAKNGVCSHDGGAAVPCVNGCPAHVDIPGYVALAGAGRYEDAVKLIRKDNPFVLACGLICEHPCELHCRRGMVDDAVNIRAIKRFAVDNAPEGGNAWTPFHYEKTGKKVAIIGGGPSGLTAAYYLALMGHEPTVFEQRDHLGGMMRYGIPAYRLPRERLDAEIGWMVAQGIDVKLGVSVPRDISFDQLKADYDAVYVAIGAHTDNKLGIPGEDAEGVLSAVDMLRAIGDGLEVDLAGKRVCVVGGGNVAMDVARSAVRLGASEVTIAYRRRIDDMTAQREEIDGAIAEGCELLELNAPVAVVTEDGKVTGIELQQQIAGPIQGGRPKPVKADCDSYVLPVDNVLVAIGQKIDSAAYGEAGMELNRGRFVTNAFEEIAGFEGWFAGGDNQSGPATVIKAIAAGKVAARNIDNYLGFDHPIKAEVDVAAALAADKPACGRAKNLERGAAERKDDFDLMEKGLRPEEACQEAGRCLRCDCFGMGALRGGRSTQW